MNYFLYFVIVLIQLTSSWAIEPLPLKCFLHNYSFLGVFDTNPGLTSYHNASAAKSLLFGTNRINAISFAKHGVVHNASDIAYHGLDDAILDDFGFNLVTKFAHLTFHTDIEVTYNYSSSGSLFSMPISGDGLAKVTVKNIQFGLSLPFDVTEVNGMKFIELKGVNSWYQVKDKTVFNFDNLYYGNKELSETMHNLYNKNWKFIVEEFGKDFCEKIVEVVYQKLKNYLLTLPLKNFSSC